MLAGRWSKLSAVVVILAVGVRVAVILMTRNTSYVPLPDEQQYWSMAESLSGGAGLVDELGFRATRMPLYPGFLAIFVRCDAGRLLALVVQAVLAGLACGFICTLTQQLLAETGPYVQGDTESAEPSRAMQLTAVLAGLLVACDPFLVYYSRFLLTENLFITALCAFVTLAWRDFVDASRQSRVARVGGAVAFALCVYIRPAVAPLLPVWCLLVCIRGRWSTVAIRTVATYCVILAAALFPWALRNRNVTGHWTWLTNRAGISLYDGVHPGASGASDLGDIKQNAAVEGLNEAEWNRYFRQASIESIRSDPKRILRLAWIKFCRTWSPWPNAPGYQQLSIRVLGGSWNLLVALGAVAGVCRLRREPSKIMLLLIPAIYFSLLHMVFVGSVRYRLPAMPFIEVLTAIGIAALWCRLKRPPAPGTSTIMEDT